ncbi:MAG: AMP-binding protein [Chloroflexota bacterium]
MNTIRHYTLPHMLKSVANKSPELGYVFEENSGATFLSYAELYSQATEWASRWQQLGLQKGERVLLVMPTTQLFAPVYWGLLLCGGVPCVLPSPMQLRGRELGIQRLRDVGQTLHARWLITTQNEYALWGASAISFPVYLVEEVAATKPAAFHLPTFDSQETAVIQATSGTTTQPKCIGLTHANVLANLHQCWDRLEIVAEDVVVSWLPLFHDMGLIGGFMMPLYWQIKGVLIPTARFIRRPARWLQAFTDHRGTLSPAPNFAYALALKRVSAAEQAKLDLSSWRSAMCGAEPIDARVLEAFAARFKSSGFEATSLTPCYGLAEAALCVTMKRMKRPLRVETICRETAATNQIAKVVASDTAESTLSVCDCGPPVIGTQIEIRDETGCVRPEGAIGRVWISGPSLMQGYVGKPQKTANMLQNGWLDTGDMGYLRNGHLFVIGRLKETIIIRGQNHFPTDFEQVAAELPEVELGKVVALGIYDEQEATERLHLVIEKRRKEKDERLITAVKQHVAQRTGILPACVTLVRHNTITRTTSGKLQRHQLKMNYPQITQAALHIQ